MISPIRLFPINSAIYSIQSTAKLLLLLAITSDVIAWSSLTRDMDITCTQTGSVEVNCAYRFLSAFKSETIIATLKGAPVAVDEHERYPWPGATTGVLILIDTSDPKRQDALGRSIAHVQTLLDLAGDRYAIGLATFDKDLIIQAPTGSSKTSLAASLADLKALGLTTELYRNLLAAIAYLSMFDYARKVILVLSDGQAEDKAYFHTDVIKAARERGVIINAIGYPRSVSLSVALQTLRRLSEESGGHFIETDTSYDLAEDRISELYANVDTGGRFSLDLSSVELSALTEPAISIRFLSEDKHIDITIPLTREKQALETDLPEPAETGVIPPTASLTTTKTDNEKPRIALLVWYGVPVALVVLILLTLMMIYLLYRKPALEAGRVTPVDPVKPYAYLVGQDERRERYAITHTTWRIGRSKDNEMPLDDHSISRKHAAIHRNDDGKFVLIDMDSLNGVFINDRQISKQTLHEGDIIEIGDIVLRFTEHAQAYPFEEKTAVLKTKNPFI